MIGPLSLAAMVVIAAILGVLWSWNYLLFHTLAELFSVVAAFATFVVAWYSREWIGRNYLLLLGLGQLFVGGFDILHAVTYKGVGILETGANTASQMWLVARGFDAATFVIAAWLPQRRWREGVVLPALGAVAVTLAVLVFSGWFPVAYRQDSGVTVFKTTTEVAVCVAFLIALWRLRRSKGDYDPQIYPRLIFCVLVKIATETCFLHYVNVTGIEHLVGHLLKIVGAWLLLCAVVEIGLKRPHALVFGAMARARGLSDEVALHATTLDAVLAATVDPVVMVDPQLRLRFISRAAEKFFGRSALEAAARTWRQAGLPETLADPVERLCRMVLADGHPVTEEIGLPRRDGPCYLEIQASPVRGENGTRAVVVVLRDISARKAMEDDLKASLEDKNVLMAEVHHRVKNNLQIVSSILQMQGWRMTDPALKAQFDQACGRILALAKVHELLYAQENVASVDFVLYVRTLCADLFRLHGALDGSISLVTQAGALPMPVGTAEPLALIVHELVSNALKHAFCERGGTLRVHLALDDGGLAVLTVNDDGARSRRVMDFQGDSTSLGLRMVGVLVQQLHGSIAVTQDRGTQVEVRFPLACPIQLLPEPVAG